MHKSNISKILSLAISLILCLTLVMGLTVTGSTAKTKTKKKTVYVLVSAETKYAKKGNTFSTKLKYNKNGSVKLIISDVKALEPVNPPKDGETPPTAPPEAPSDQPANPPAPPADQSANPPADLKEVKYKRTTKVAYRDMPTTCRSGGFSLKTGFPVSINELPPYNCICCHVFF